MPFSHTRPSRSPRRGHVIPLSRARRALMAALAFVLLASTALVTAQIPAASAFIPADIPPSTADQPTGTATLTHSPGTPSPTPDPIQGDTFTSTAVFTLSNMEETGVSHTVVVTVTADSNTPWTSNPTAANFTGIGGTPTLSDCSRTSCTATFTNVTTNGTITFTSPAQSVIRETASGSLVAGTARVDIITTPEVSLEPVQARFIADPDDSCTGVYEYAQRVADGGAWLMDMHFADGNGQGLVQLDADPTILPYDPDNPGRNRIRVVDADGADITATVFNRPDSTPRYISPDPNKPYFPNDAIQTGYPNARWLDSMNWNYDPSTWTGDTWLPAGSVITVWRGVTYQNCINGYTTNLDVDRPFGVSIEVARLGQSTVSDTAVDAWSMPGTPLEPARCVDNLFVSNTSRELHKWDSDAGSTSRVSIETRVTHAIAATDRYDDRIFYVSRPEGTNQRLSIRNTTNNVTVETQTFMPTASMSNVDALAFDPDGNLWAGFGSRLYYLTVDQVKQIVENPSVQQTWNQGASVTGTRSSTWWADFAFDGDGHLWAAHIGSLSGEGIVIYKIPTAELMTATATVSVGSPMPTGVAYSGSAISRGLAFVGDTLYLGQQRSNSNANTSRQLYTINRSTGQATWAAGPGFNVPNLTDFASCSFPTDNPVAAFAVKKSVVNRDGTISDPGTNGDAVSVNPDGTVTVHYVVTVSNVTRVAGTSPAVTDTVTLPDGFTITDVKLDGVSQDPPTPFTIPGLELAGLASKSYVVSVTARAPDMSAVDWAEAGTCDTAGAGNPGAGGFFNLVTMEGDADGPENNDACVPVDPPAEGNAQLALIKRILDAAGNEIGTSTDSQYFTLVAGPQAGAGTSISGSSPTSGDIAVDRTVFPGTYILSERGNDDGTVSGTYTPGDWSCVTRPGGAPVSVTDNTITLGNGDNVACTISNTRSGPVHVVKTATHESEDNPHIGQTITPAADGTFTAEYTITVTNTADHTVNTGQVTDFFVPPAGVVWDGTKTATITYAPGTTGATIASPSYPATATAVQLESGFTLADTIQGLPAGEAVTFTISIPLKLDFTVVEGETQSNYELNAADLGQCRDLTSNGGNSHTDMALGIPNNVALAGEDLTYTDIPLEDNIACIPVVKPEPQTTWKVAKFAHDPANEDSPHVGTPVQVGIDGKVSVSYRVVVTNSGEHPGAHPEITDTITPPTDFTIENVTVTPNPEPGTYQGPTFTIPAGEAEIASGETVAYVVTVNLVADLATASWEVAGECKETNGYATSGGIFNSVAMNGDTDGDENNDACVPVTPPTTPITLVKQSISDADGTTGTLDGAEFALYDEAPGADVEPIVESVPSTSAGVFRIDNLTFGQTYWLVETKAPDGHALLATPVEFTMSLADGAWTINVVDLESHSTLVQVAEDELQITILDVLAGDLPEAGSSGYVPFTILGLLLVGVGVLSTRRPPGQRAPS